MKSLQLSSAQLSSARSSSTARPIAALAALAGVALVCVQCANTGSSDDARAKSAAAFATVYSVLQHPRCLNCHPVGRAPLQGDEHRPHGQNVVGGPDGKGLYALRCVNCHLEHNSPGANLPPGAPGWHLPAADMPLVFEGRTPRELALQLADPAHNGKRSAQQLLEHVSHDPLVLWGWNPGEGRAAVSVPHAEFVAAMKTWIDGGMQAP